MEIPRHWRLKQQRYALVGEVCPHCDHKIFPPRDVCPNCGGGFGQEVTGTCCVRCNRVTACGCAVEMECGSCCSGECCN